MLSFVLAQTVDPISGGAGWIGAGLLGLVLGWLLLVHLPAKDKRDKDKDEHHAAQIREIVAAGNASMERMAKAITDQHAATMKSQSDAFIAVATGQKAAFERTIDIVLAHCKGEMEERRQDVAGIHSWLKSIDAKLDK